LAAAAAEEADLGMGSLLVEEFFTLFGGILIEKGLLTLAEFCSMVGLILRQRMEMD
jgi:hypothetical protein